MYLFALTIQHVAAAQRVKAKGKLFQFLALAECSLLASLLSCSLSRITRKATRKMRKSRAKNPVAAKNSSAYFWRQDRVSLNPGMHLGSLKRGGKA